MQGNVAPLPDAMVQLRLRLGTPFALSPEEPEGRVRSIYGTPLLEALMLAELYPVAAIGYSIIYMLLGGGLGGAVLIFIVAKMLGR